ncbi:MAG: RNase P subunit p30 family protein [Nanoarchaeota archaeon]|nr:RNase P subunit p30 family protein [Nanoarchaeota archaeon]
MIDIVRCVIDGKIKAHGIELGFSSTLSKKEINIKEGNTEDKNRNYFSDKSVDIVMNPEIKTDRDKIHYRKSGMNQVFAKLAKEKDIAVGFGFSFILNADSIKRSEILGKMRQNVRICRKAKCKMIVCSYANDYREMRGAKDLLSFARIIGMTPGEAKKALEWKRDKKKIRFV